MPDLPYFGFYTVKIQAQRTHYYLLLIIWHWIGTPKTLMTQTAGGAVICWRRNCTR